MKGLELRGSDINKASLSQLRNSGLERINLGESDFDDTGAKQLSMVRSLIDVTASNTDLSDEGVCALASLPKLYHLSLTGTHTSDRSLFALAKCRSLGSLELRGDKRITDKGISALEHLNLTDLDLGSTSITDESMKYIARMPRLNTIHVNQTAISINGVRQLCKSTSIFRVDVQKCSKLTAAEIKQLRQDYPAISFQDIE